MTTLQTRAPALRATDIHKRFGGLVVLNGISLEVRPGEIHALIGPNGAGKSTFFKIISGELEADGGSVEAFGEDVTGLKPHLYPRKGIGRAFQIPNVFADMTVIESVVIAVEAGSRWGVLPRSEQRWVVDPVASSVRRAEEMLATLGLERWAHRRVDELPHGDHKLVELAMTAVQEPRLLLLDEPMAGMSPREAHRCGDVIEELNQEHGISALLTEHDMDAVFRLATRVTVLAGGQLIASGPPEEIREDEGVREAYLGTGH